LYFGVVGLGILDGFDFFTFDSIVLLGPMAFLLEDLVMVLLWELWDLAIHSLTPLMFDCSGSWDNMSSILLHGSGTSFCSTPSFSCSIVEYSLI